MPWSCSKCRAKVPDDQATCPGCSGAKSTWTLQVDKTRNFVISRAKFKLLRGEVQTSTPVSEGLYDPYALVEPTVARVLTKQAVLGLFERGQQPASYDVLVVRLFPKDEMGDVKLVVDYAVRDLFEEAFPVPEAPFVDVPFVFIAGPETMPAEFGFTRMNVVDITEETERGFAPELEFSALNRPAVELPTEAAASKDPEPDIASTVLPGGLFALESSFPTPAIAPYLDHLAKVTEEHPEVQLGIFGHADVSGSEDYNKHLTDRRAMAVKALLTSDRQVFDWIALEEDWGLDVYQTMLRALTCNPGALDGETGPLTEAAVELFQEISNAGHFGLASSLDVDADLGPATKAAIRAAYLTAFGLELGEGQFHGPGTSGCSEFNPLGGAPERDRRVVVAAYADERPGPSEFPCQAGSAAACTLGGGGPQRCSFYRERIKETDPEIEFHPFFDFQWLALPSGKVNLSAVTTLPSGTDVTFQAYRCVEGLPPDLPACGEGSPDTAFGEPISEPLPGVIRHGVALCLWDPPDPHPFNVASWFVAGEQLSLKERYEGKQTFQPPVFVVRSGEQWGISRPPGQRLDRLHIEGVNGEIGTLLSSAGELVNFSVDAERATVAGRQRSDPHFEVIALLGELSWKPQEEDSNA